MVDRILTLIAFTLIIIGYSLATTQYRIIGVVLFTLGLVIGIVTAMLGDIP